MTRLGQRAIWVAIFSTIPFILLVLLSAPAGARQYAAMVMDARTGKVLHSRNADTRLHPASLTKMMTLYVAFEAVERGEISLDTKVRVSKNAAAEPASKLYLKAGQRIALRYLIRASAVKSANDAATTIAEAISGSESAFAARMTRTAKALGMKNTTFKNAHGLTRSGHLSTARDMTILGRHVFYDYPEYYNLFSRRTTNAGVTQVANTNRRLLNSYRGADGIKTGYTNAAGSNLVASAERGGVRIIATMFGGSSSAARNKRVAELLDMGFARAPKYAKVRKPALPNYAYASATQALVQSSPIPRARPAQIVVLAAAAKAQVPATDQLAANATTVPTDEPPAETATIAVANLPPKTATEAVTEAATGTETSRTTPPETETALVVAILENGEMRPVPRPGSDTAPIPPDTATTDLPPETSDAIVADAALETPEPQASDVAVARTPDMVTMRRGVEDTISAIAATETDDATARAVAVALTQVPQVLRPQRRPARVTYSTSDMAVAMATPANHPVVVSTKDSATGKWGVRVGRYNTRYEAERVLLQTALQQVDLLADARRTVVSGAKGYEVQFVGLSQHEATLTCQRLSALDERCATFGS